MRISLGLVHFGLNVANRAVEAAKSTYLTNLGNKMNDLSSYISKGVLEDY